MSEAKKEFGDNNPLSVGAAGVGAAAAELADLAKYFAWLDALRNSGSINMFGATPVLCEQFDLRRSEGRAILKLWMDSDLSKTPAERAAKARAAS